MAKFVFFILFFELSKFLKSELIRQLEEHGLPTHGLKKELCQRLYIYLRQEEAKKINAPICDSTEKLQAAITAHYKNNKKIKNK